MSPDPECSRCGNSVAAGAKFCRHCGSAVEATDVDAGAADATGKVSKEPRSCPACNATVAPDASFCRSCGTRLSGAAAERVPAARAASPASPGSPPEAQAGPTQAPRAEAPAGQVAGGAARGPLFALGAVAGCLALAGLVGGGAYLLTRDDDREASALYEQPLVPWEGAGAASSSTESESLIPDEPSTEVPPPEPQPEFDEASEAFLAHWQAIADGRYGEAYDLFHPGYEAERAGWIETHESEATLVNLDGVTLEPGTTEPHEDEYWLYVEVPLRDGGGAYAGDCRVFFGEVRMAQDAGDLLYRPGVYRGREGTFGRSDLGGGVRDVPESDSRCP